jgi:hypothetical protein
MIIRPQQLRDLLKSFSGWHMETYIDTNINCLVLCVWKGCPPKSYRFNIAISLKKLLCALVYGN